MCKQTIHEYRVSKYDITKRIQHVFTGDDWTSISDIGQTFNGEVLTYSEYLRVESGYMSFIERICDKLNVSKLKITGLEDYRRICPYRNKQILRSVAQITNVARDCLREDYWCRMESKKLFFHFGYEFYLYIGSPLTYDTVAEIAKENGLYVEALPSPYHRTKSDNA